MYHECANNTYYLAYSCKTRNMIEFTCNCIFVDSITHIKKTITSDLDSKYFAKWFTSEDLKPVIQGGWQMTTLPPPTKH